MFKAKQMKSYILAHLGDVRGSVSAPRPISGQSISQCNRPLSVLITRIFHSKKLSQPTQTSLFVQTVSRGRLFNSSCHPNL